MNNNPINMVSMKIKNVLPSLLFTVIILLLASCSSNKKTSDSGASDSTMIRSIEKAQEWGNGMPWLRGSDFISGSEINPSQPVSCRVWSDNLKDLNKFQLKNSDSRWLRASAVVS